jgi:hypothetical protein|tara:strand:- start:81 stop:797 length:717 start_codon:yes stop_codon:yes gene_type:complete
MKAILFLALSAIILFQSYGFVYAQTSVDRATELEPEQPVLTVETDALTYETGDVINVSGSVSDYDGSDLYESSVVAVRLIAPNNNIVSIFQLPLNDDGSYSSDSLDKPIIAGGPQWKFDGDYTISVNHGADRSASITFAFVLAETEEVIEEVIEEAEEVIEISEEELSEGCGPGTHLVDGVCILDETAEPVSVSTGSSPTTGFSSWVYSISFTVLIAFAIMIILYLISRASKNKIVNS